MLGRDAKCCQDLLIFKISPRVLVLLVRKLFLRPESFQKPARRDLARAVTRVVLITEQNQTGHDCQWNEHQTLGKFFAVIQKNMKGPEI